jgi:DnaJ-domain-containing protein 1
MSIGTSKLAGMPQDHRAKLESCVKLLLLWVAASDGKLEEAELEFLNSHFPDRTHSITNDEFLAVIRSADLGSIEKAIRMVAQESRELRLAFLDMAIAMSMIDRDIAVAENHILRFYADALHLGLGSLEKRFQAVTGRPMDEPGDPSDPEWWQQLQGQSVEAGEDQGNTPETGAASGQMSFGQARSVLGVSLNASQQDIEQAYERLASIFEVSRVEAMGEAAVSLANSRFKKIQQAYWLLKG